jgi:hypothetical protein
MAGISSMSEMHIWSHDRLWLGISSSHFPGRPKSYLYILTCHFVLETWVRAGLIPESRTPRWNSNTKWPWMHCTGKKKSSIAIGSLCLVVGCRMKGRRLLEIQQFLLSRDSKRSCFLNGIYKIPNMLFPFYPLPPEIVGSKTHSMVNHVYSCSNNLVLQNVDP